MNRLLILAYGVITYIIFNCVFLYMIGFVCGAIVPKNIDSGIRGSIPEALLVDFILVLLFGVSHSIMARPGFKKELTKYIPEAAERSTFVLVASIVLAILFWQWQPIDTPIWTSSPPLSMILMAVSLIGWAVILWSTFLIDHFELFGISQVLSNYRGVEHTSTPFVIRSLYKYVRHPLMLGFLIAFWFTPIMTVGHLFFTCAMTAYILIGIFYEERDLAKHLGDGYSQYREHTPMILPGTKR
jgi:methanethiol S-methyltransferase